MNVAEDVIMRWLISIEGLFHKGLRRNLWVTFAHRTYHGPTDGADRVVRSIRVPIANERSERPFDGGFDAKRPGEARGAVGRYINDCFNAQAMNPAEKNPLGKSEGTRCRLMSLKPLVTGATEHVVAAVRAKATHRFPGRGELRTDFHVRCHAGALSRHTSCAHQAPEGVPKDVHEGIRTGYPGYCLANWLLERAWKAKISGMDSGRRLCRTISRLLVGPYPDKLLSLFAVGPIQGGNRWTRSAH